MEYYRSVVVRRNGVFKVDNLLNLECDSSLIFVFSGVLQVLRFSLGIPFSLTNKIDFHDITG